MERALDPLTMKFRDETKEQTASAIKLDRTVTQVLKRNETLKNTTYNIISHEGPSRKIDGMREIMKDQEEKPNRQWNMFSHLPHAQQTTCPILFDAKYMNTHARPNTVNQIAMGMPPREFNVVTNQFAHDHDKKLRKEYDGMKHDMVKKYWEKHDLDPVRMEYYDDDKEINYIESRRHLQNTHGKNIDDHLPPTYKAAEGKAYNLLTLEIKDNEKLKRALSSQIREKNRLTKFRDLIAKQKETGAEEFFRKDAMQVARVGYDRWQQEIDRGYDFVSTQQNAASRYKPLPNKKASLWEKVSVPNGVENTSRNDANSPTTYRSNDFSARGSARGGNTSTCSARGKFDGQVTAASPRSNAVLNATSSTKVPNLNLSTALVRTGGLSGLDQ